MSGGEGFRLVALDCPSCGAAVSAAGEDVVYYCTACRNGYRFAGDGLEPVEVAFLATSDRAADHYLPFWLLPATVAIHERKAEGGGFSGLLGFFTGDGGAEAAAQPAFAVPAFDAPLAAVTQLIRAYTERPEPWGERLGERLAGGRYGVEDAKKLAHYALIATEVEKPDTLIDLRYSIDFAEPRLLGVPFVGRGEAFEDALFGITVPAPVIRRR